MSLSFVFALTLSSAIPQSVALCQFETSVEASVAITETAVPDAAAASGVAPVGAGDPVPDPQLAAIRGTQLPLVGLDQVDAAADAAAIYADAAGTPPSGFNRDLVDIWNFAVQNPLILDAIRQSQGLPM